VIFGNSPVLKLEQSSNPSPELHKKKGHPAGWPFFFFLVAGEGFEPPTFGL
tara:strand:- start:415 stop:567 length:153 start_codon:yes stop_codon:yes gene_type:complete